jgi:hypothetical protein
MWDSYLNYGRFEECRLLECGAVWCLHLQGRKNMRTRKLLDVWQQSVGIFSKRLTLFSFAYFFYPEDGSDMFHRNVGTYKSHMTSYPRRRHSSLPWKSQIIRMGYFVAWRRDWVHFIHRPLLNLFYQPRMINGVERGAVRGMTMGCEYRSTRENQPQRPHDLTWDRARATAVGGRPHQWSEWMPVV